MKCQFCNKNEADQLFYLDYMGGLYQISICNDCLQRMWNQAAASGQAETFRRYSGWWPGKPEARRYGERVFPLDAAVDLKKKRRLALLKVKLLEASTQEHYEEAARLRDDIAVIEKEVCSHENESGIL